MKLQGIKTVGTIITTVPEVLCINLHVTSAVLNIIREIILITTTQLKTTTTTTKHRKEKKRKLLLIAISRPHIFKMILILFIPVM